MVNKKSLKKFSFRLLVVMLIFFSVKWTIVHNDNSSFFSPTAIFYFTSAFILVMLTWEVNDWLIKRQLKFSKGLDIQESLKTIVFTFSFLTPASAFIYYLGIYEFDNICNIYTENKGLLFRINFMRALLLGFVIMAFNMFYFSVKHKKNLEQKLQILQKEVLASKYKSLKSQISPHFLFNSLNTLTSLMYEDRDLASDFVTRLASSYRYILDNKEENIVSLKKELNFLDSFIFMMNVRHSDSITINTKISVNAKDYLIPTLSLQMLVENAIKHNYFSNEKPMIINVYTVGKIALVVENSLRKRKLKGESTQLGIMNIKKRYSFYTNQEISVESENNYFKVTMPLLDKKALESQILSVS